MAGWFGRPWKDRSEEILAELLEIEQEDEVQAILNAPKEAAPAESQQCSAVVALRGVDWGVMEMVPHITAIPNARLIARYNTYYEGVKEAWRLQREAQQAGKSLLYWASPIFC